MSEAKHPSEQGPPGAPMPGNPTETTAAPASPSGAPQRIAPLWHTTVLVVAILLLSAGSSNRQHLVITSRTRVLEYLLTLAWEWLLFAFCIWGARKSGTGLRELVGGRWREIEDVLIDILTAAGFWVAAMVVLSLTARLLHLAGHNQLDDVRRQIGFLVPRSAHEVVLWILLSVTAGICEEVVFRGYLQRQLAALTRNVWAGIAVSGLIFGSAHGYEGAGRMMLVGIYGMLFGLLAHFRRSLRPGMIAHAFHDGIMGLALRFFLK
jgi:membrane protease YdiL (CAAX protease family)